jgi:predicted nucleic acid-binding Zn finger protein
MEIDQSRLERALSQRIYVMYMEVDLHKALFEVMGAVGQEYTVVLRDHEATCTCIDFMRRKLPCKHLLNILCKVVHLEPLQLRSYKEFLPGAIQRLRTGQSVPRIGRDLENERGDDTCSICYEDILQTDRLDKCLECKHLFHSDCIHKWLTRNSTCPLCRSPY